MYFNKKYFVIFTNLPCAYLIEYNANVHVQLKSLFILWNMKALLYPFGVVLLERDAFSGRGF